MSCPSAITRSQKNFFQGIKARSHIVTKVYAFTEAADDVMLIGIVNWEFDNGKKYEQEFVARFLIEGPHSAKPTMKLYQGWAVSLLFMTNLTALILDTMLT